MECSGPDTGHDFFVPVETEIKLQFLEDLGDRAFRSALRNAVGPVIPRCLRRHLVSTYYDTGTRDLAARNCTLRLRRVGDARTQTLKIPMKAVSGKNIGLQTYHEFESPADGQRPDLSQLAVSNKVIAWLRQCEPALKPVFTTDIRRTIWLVQQNVSQIELAWDRGEIQAEGRVEPVNELELELKSGSRSDLLDLAASLVEHLPVRLGDATKAERGDALAHDQDPVAVRSSALHLPGKTPISDAFRRCVADCIGQMRANERGIRAGGNPEAVHQFRVALRRLRAVISTCRDIVDEDVYAHWQADLRWAHQAFGRARDLDVLAGATLAPLQRQLPEDRDIAAFAQLVAETREQAHRQARSAIEEKRYTLVLLDIAQRLDAADWGRRSAAATAALPAREFAVARLQRRFKKVRNLSEKWSRLTAAERHRLRIHVKKLRYMTNSFASLFPTRVTRSFQQGLERLQDVLGALNDAWVGRQYVQDLTGVAIGSGSLTETAALRLRALFAGWHRRGIADCDQQFDTAWRAFAAQRRFWKT